MTGWTKVKPDKQWSRKEQQQLTRCKVLAQTMSRFKLPAYCLKFYENPLTAELRKHKSAKQIWGQTFHPGTPEDTNKREHYNAKSASPADDTSRFQVYEKGREATKEAHQAGLRRTR